MRDIPQHIQMEAIEAEIDVAVAMDGPVKQSEKCSTPDDWMARGFQIGTRMKSSVEFMAGWHGAIDAILKG